MKPNQLIDNMVEKSKAEVKPTIPQKTAAPNIADNLDPKNPKYKGFSRSDITNAKLVEDGDEFDDFDTKQKRKLSVIKYIPYGALEDGDNGELYGVVNNFDGSDTFKGGAIVSHSPESARDDLKSQTQLGIQGADRYLKRGKYDEEFFNIMKENREEGDDEHYKQLYGWDFNKPFAEHDFMKNDPYQKYLSSKQNKTPLANQPNEANAAQQPKEAVKENPTVTPKRTKVAGIKERTQNSTNMMNEYLDAFYSDDEDKGLTPQQKANKLIDEFQNYYKSYRDNYQDRFGQFLLDYGVTPIYYDDIYNDLVKIGYLDDPKYLENTDKMMKAYSFNMMRAIENLANRKIYQ